MAYLGFLTESRRFGMRPCLSVEANAIICRFAAVKLPVVKNRPRSEMKTSLNKQRAKLLAKWGRPAAKEGKGLEGSSDADFTTPCI